MSYAVLVARDLSQSGQEDATMVRFYDANCIIIFSMN